MMSVISLEEYKKKVADDFRELCKVYPKEEVEEYLREKDSEIERGYYEELSIMDIVGCPPSPSGCAYGMALEF